MLYFFVFWCCLSDPPAIVTLPKQITRLARTPRDWHLLGVASNLFLVALMSTSLFWTFSSVLIEYSSNYGNGRDMAEFIQSHEMDKLTIVAQWKNTIDSETYEQEVDFNQMRGVVLLPYFDNNIISNLNPDSREPYLIHKIDKEGTSIAKLLANKLPDMLIGRAEIEAIYNNKQVINNYAMINYFRGNTIWKGHKMPYIDILFMRRELLKKYPDISEKKYVDINAG